MAVFALIVYTGGGVVKIPATKEHADVARHEPTDSAEAIAGRHGRRGAGVALGRGGRAGRRQGRQPAAGSAPTAPANALPMGQIGKLKVSRMLLGGNLLTHYTHSRDLQYVYPLAAHYNTDEKIMETLAVAEQHGINTMSMHNPPHPMGVLKEYRRRGGKIQWIICPTAEVEDHMEAYTVAVKELVDAGCEAIYLWGVHSDPLASQRPGRPDRQGRRGGEEARRALGRRLPRSAGSRGVREGQGAGRFLHQDLPSSRAIRPPRSRSNSQATAPSAPATGAKTRRGRSS